ncbi:MAG: C40 family peptidase [Eggerthellaceae bacterium]|nr:C40 family peptidase [Eggerthellaceae bacterium]
MKSSSPTRFVRAAIACACAIVIALPLAIAPRQQAYAVTAAEVEAQAQDVLVQLMAMQETLDDLSEQYFAALYDYQAAVESRDAAQARIDELNERIAEIQDRLGERARDMYRGGSVSAIDLLLGSASFVEFTTNWDLLNRVNQTDADLVEETRLIRIETEEQKAEFQKQADIASKKSEEAAKAYADAEVIVAEMQETYNALSAEAQALYAAEAQAAYERELAAQRQAAAAAAASQHVEVNDDGTVTDTNTGETYESASAYYEETGNAVVDRAYSMIGSDYVWGGVGGDWGGFDCSGLVSYALTGENIRVGTTATFITWDQVDDPQPGDVCVIHEEDGNQHTGIYVGDGKMVHASTYGIGVVESDVQEGMIYVRP